MQVGDEQRIFARPGTVPQIHQSEAAECGLVCLNMIGWAHGQKVDLATLRRRYSLSLKGLTLRSLMEIAGQMGFATRPVRFELDDIDQLTLPCILHWDLSHYVVLVAANRRRIVVHDPAHGRRAYSLAAASDHVTGVALEVTPSATFRPESSTQKLRISDFWSRSQGMARSIGYLAACIVLVELCSLIYPFVSQLIVDTAIANGDTKLVFVVALAFVALLLLRSATTMVRSLLMVRLSTSISYQMEVNLFKHLLRLPTPFFERRHVGDVVSRFESVRLGMEGMASAVRKLARLLAAALLSAAVPCVPAQAGEGMFLKLGDVFNYPGHSVTTDELADGSTFVFDCDRYVSERGVIADGNQPALVVRTVCEKAGRHRRGTVVYLHGGPWAAAPERPTQELSALLSLGYELIVPLYPGSSDRQLHVEPTKVTPTSTTPSRRPKRQSASHSATAVEWS